MKSDIIFSCDPKNGPQECDPGAGLDWPTLLAATAALLATVAKCLPVPTKDNPRYAEALVCHEHAKAIADHVAAILVIIANNLKPKPV